MFFGVFFVKPLVILSSICYNVPVASSGHDFVSGYISGNHRTGAIKRSKKIRKEILIMKKYLILAVLALALSLTAVACSDNNTTTETETATETVTETVADTTVNETVAETVVEDESEDESEAESEDESESV